MYLCAPSGYTLVHACPWMSALTPHSQTCCPHGCGQDTTTGMWSVPANISVHSKCVPVLPFAHPSGQQTHLCLFLPAQSELNPGNTLLTGMSTPLPCTHCSQFSLLSCRSARKRLDARVSSSRSSSCRCNSRMAERMRRRSARSAVTSNCGVGGLVILAAGSRGRAPAAHSSACGTMNGLSPLPLPSAHHVPACPPTQSLRGRPSSCRQGFWIVHCGSQSGQPPSANLCQVPNAKPGTPSFDLAPASLSPLSNL